MIETTTPSAYPELYSPFMQCINECRTKMKKLRKKIYKNLKNKPHIEDTPKHKLTTLNVNKAIREEKIPQFLNVQTAVVSRDTGLRDITNFSITKKIDHQQIRAYADEQEREVEQILLSIAQQKLQEDFFVMIEDEEHSA